MKNKKQTLQQNTKALIGTMTLSQFREAFYADRIPFMTFDQFQAHERQMMATLH